MSRKMQIVCQRGHPMEGDNLYVYPNGMRNCRICRNLADRRTRRNAKRVYELEAQLTQAQGRIAELEGWVRDVRTYFHLGPSVADNAEDWYANMEAYMDDSYALVPGEQQPTTLTKEGGGGE